MNRKEALIQMAQQRGVAGTVAKAALEDADRKAVQTLLGQIIQAPDSHFVFPKYIDEVLRAAIATNKLLEIADLLLEQPSNVLYPLARELGTFTDEKSILILRRIVSLEWASEGARIAAASALIGAAYLGDCEQALLDPLELVRSVAAKQLEYARNTPILIQALSNTSEVVRRIAAWYMGCNKVDEAVESLLQMITTENDVEALRAAIWSLGVLRVKDARHKLEQFLNHENHLIRFAAQDAIVKLG